MEPGATAVTSPDAVSAEVFREQDSEFLQKQAKWWLEEVTHEPLDDEKSTAEIVQNGSLLVKLGRGLLKLKEDPSKELKDVMAAPGPTVKMAFMAYANVDEFLNICKELGMEDSYLPTSSDIVEQKNTRSTCLMLRGLSKLARQHLGLSQVADFDDMTAKPKRMSQQRVGGITRDLSNAQERAKDVVTSAVSDVAKLKHDTSLWQVDAELEKKRKEEEAKKKEAEEAAAKKKAEEAEKAAVAAKAAAEKAAAEKEAAEKAEEARLAEELKVKKAAEEAELKAKKAAEEAAKKAEEEAKKAAKKAEEEAKKAAKKAEEEAKKAAERARREAAGEPSPEEVRKRLLVIGGGILAGVVLLQKLLTKKQ
eukprot:jgi/Mesvir1/23608/Mv18291-RA.2